AAVVVGLILVGYGGLMGVAIERIVGERQQPAAVAAQNRSRPGLTVTPAPANGLPPGPAAAAPGPQGTAAIRFDAIKDEAEQGRAGVKLVKLDLSPAGIDATMDVPEGCVLKPVDGEVQVVKNAAFSLKVGYGKGEMPLVRSILPSLNPQVNSKDLLFIESLGVQRFIQLHVLGYQD